VGKILGMIWNICRPAAMLLAIIPVGIGLLLLNIFGCRGASKAERERRKRFDQSRRLGRSLKKQSV